MDPLKEYVKAKIIDTLAKTKYQDDIFDNINDSMIQLVEEGKIETYVISKNNVEDKIKSINFESDIGFRYTINLETIDTKEVKKLSRYYKINNIIR